ncbi:MAG: SDR family NAD(P)-dependent oxidoreductase [Chloroflexi bacterium]|nr:SDR family NAD(P)-dependent oxidoreductase [Chloroflexota bacterium]
MAKALDQQVVVITGASSGIGRETALRLAGRGAKLVLSARREDSLDELVNEIKAQGGAAISTPADVSLYQDVEVLVGEAVKTYGRIDTWVNNAGVLLVSEFEHADLEEARRVFDVNFWGEYYGCKAVLPVMKEQGGGTIINVTSVTGKRGLPLMSVYSASKAALNVFTETLRTELMGSNIEVCLVLPATIDTPLYQHARSKEGVAPRPAPPIYPSSEVAKAIEKVAASPRRLTYAGSAGQFFVIVNTLMPGVLDRVLGAVGRPALLSKKPERATGHDNLREPMNITSETASGGWRSEQYKAHELGSRIAMGIAAFFVVRKLVRK